MTRPRKETPRLLPDSATPEQRHERAKDRAVQMADPGNNDAIDPDRAKWGWIAAGVIIVAGLGVTIYDSIVG
ncbi:hypothetical protein [Candidatus Lucifugimonas marina]|uniref:Uncharacterized protein n=1 Tax=Candidatus Lucifugimonas marina TaxID=3038979 RepID=A0AAJ5ZIR1_9CHLR|nr:hypothetical protein [SAR202 cluster bacterium JH702]MDG0870243.1 hypothetical protein [SAR202 cluster bacterium JH639]WFG36194.1 hypothetical protein GKN94_10980 [SAR202 cluster bacterium JH545]WFG40140.1 hypothetical protein GKO48_11085 [SAR202 cluster bacterium JH1073]